jgi:hypothetical protein
MTDVEYFKGYNLITVDSGFQIRAKKIIYCIGYESKNLIKEHFVNLKSTYAIVSEIDPKNLKTSAILWSGIPMSLICICGQRMTEEC